MSQNAMEIREKIISLIKIKGPSLPVQIAKETGLSILFASAFLSELYNEKEINISNIKVGSSPLYFIPGQEFQLENFSQYLKSKEKDAFILIKEKKILKDSEQEPAIRIALREIKDFAIPFKKGEEIYWRYFLVSEENINLNEETKKEESIQEEILENKKEEKEEVLEDQEKNKKKNKLERKSKKQNNKKNENFFNKIKEFLSKEEVEILDIKDFKNNEAVLKIKRNGEEELFYVFNKKKITEMDILKAHKKAHENKMRYSICFLGETPKKIQDLISAIKDLSKIDKIK